VEGWNGIELPFLLPSVLASQMEMEEIYYKILLRYKLTFQGLRFG
jgi:hypothetical protein